MRIDLFMNKVCLTKTRTIAKTACDKNLVRLNGKTAKASHEVKAGDKISFDLYNFRHEVEVLQVPTGNVAKSDATRYYTLLEKSPLG
jgi:ribosomal 50S subunit-recycling heat shock protein